MPAEPGNLVAQLGDTGMDAGCYFLARCSLGRLKATNYKCVPVQERELAQYILIHIIIPIIVCLRCIGNAFHDPGHWLTIV